MTRIASFNINGIKARLPRLLEWLEETRPSVACLQEIKTQDEGFPAAEFEKIGYHAIWHGQKGFNGVAVLAKGDAPTEQRRGLPGDPDDTHSRYLEARVHTPDGDLTVASIYLPNGNPQPGPKFDYKLAWFERLIQHAQTLYARDEPVVLAGDYNVVPTEFDIYETTSYDDDALVQPESRAAFQRLLDQGWVDAIRARHPKERIYTFWDYMRKRWERNAGLRIDHLLLNPQMAKRLVAANVDKHVRGRPGASDHAPTWIEVSAGKKAVKRGKASAKRASRGRS